MIEELSEKQIIAYQQSNARINIFEGAVRSGKSFIALIRWLEFIRNGPYGPLLIAGKTEKTIKLNIINPLRDLVGSGLRYYAGKGEVHLFNRVMHVVGACDDRSEGKIRGNTFAGALVDECSLIPEPFFETLLDRLSIDGAKLFTTTNPDSPFHWLKTKFIDRQRQLDLKVFSFRLDDNPSLSEKFKSDLKREHQGLWYKRFIDGLWVLAEGAIFDFFDETRHVILYPHDQADYYIVGVDYGTTNPCTFVMIGYNPFGYPNIWLEKEYYYDSKKEQAQKSDFEYAQDFKEFISGFNVKTIYIDPSAASFKRELQRNNIYNIQDAVNDVLPGIRYHANLLSSGAYKICSGCVNAIKEYQTYVWDEKACLRGEDKPLKQNDHTKDAERYALFTHFFNKPGPEAMTEVDAQVLEELYTLKRY